MASTTKKSARGGGNSIHLHRQPSSPPTISCSSNSSGSNSINGDTPIAATTTSSSSSSTTINSSSELPKTFIVAMRTLFDIMADESTGYVRFTDIEQRWREGSAGMPRGVIDSLRKFLLLSFFFFIIIHLNEKLIAHKIVHSYTSEYVHR